MKRSKRGAYGKTPVMPKTLGQRIRLARISWKWSQTQLADALGTNQQTVSHWEQERQQPTDATLHALAALFGMNVRALTSGKGFYVPDPPQSIGNLLVAANLAADLIKLPPVRKKGIWLIPRGEESPQLLSLQSATTLICQAFEKGQPVWIVM